MFFSSFMDIGGSHLKKFVSVKKEADSQVANITDPAAAAKNLMAMFAKKKPTVTEETEVPKA